MYSCQQSFANEGGELTGDTDGDTAATMRDSDIIVTTPEKWDSVTRKLKDHARLTDMIRLLLVKMRLNDLHLIFRLMKYTYSMKIVAQSLRL